MKKYFPAILFAIVFPLGLAFVYFTWPADNDMTVEEFARVVALRLAPFLVTVIFIWLRRAYGNRGYGLAFSFAFVVAFTFFMLKRGIGFYYCGVLCAAGMETWTFPVSVLAIGTLCAVRFKSRYTTASQGIIAFMIGEICLQAGIWVS